MTEKINKKYSNLSDPEREIISNYVFYSSQEGDYLKDYLAEKRKSALELLENFEDKETNQILVEKVGNVRAAIHRIDEQEINDETVIRFLTITKLISELARPENKNGWFKSS